MKRYVIHLVFLCAVIITVSGSVSAADNSTAPVANFTSDQTFCFDPLPVQFQDLSTGDIDSYEWDFGDGTNSTEQSPHHTYTRPGLFSVTLTVTGPGGSDTLKIDNYIDVKDKDAPVPKANIKGGLYNKNLSVKLTATDNDPSATITIYYTLDGKDPTRNNQPSSQKLYTGPITISKEGITKLKFIAIDSAPTGNTSPVETVIYTIDKTAPKATASLKTGLYRTDQKITLKSSEKGSIYYALNGNTSKKYTGPIKITKTSKLKFYAVDLAGNKSPIYTKTYTIDKTKPKLISTSHKNKSTVSRTSTFSFKFSEKIKSSVNWSKIYVKNLKTGKKVALSKTIKNNILYLKTNKKSIGTWYQVYIPGSSVKDAAGNNLAKGYTYKFKTGTK